MKRIFNEEQFSLVYITAFGTLQSLFVMQYSRVYMDQLELIFWLLVHLQFMYLQYMYLSIVVHTYTVVYCY